MQRPINLYRREGIFMKKHIYVLLSQTNTKTGAFIRFASGYEFNHISISANENLQPLYSYARYNYNSTFVGGFIEESLLRYFFQCNRFKARIYTIDVSDIQYEAFQSMIATYMEEREKYIYDTLGVLPWYTSDSKYHKTCLSFVISVLKELDLIPADTKSNTIKKFESCLSKYPCKDTYLEKDPNTTYTWGNDKFYEKVPSKQVFKNTITHFKKLFS